MPAAAVSARIATRGDIQQSLSYSGDIRAREQISVLPKASGRVGRVLVDVGSRVNAGDTLATLEQESVQITVLAEVLTGIDDGQAGRDQQPERPGRGPIPSRLSTGSSKPSPSSKPSCRATCT